MRYSQFKSLIPQLYIDLKKKKHSQQNAYKNIVIATGNEA